MGGQTSSHKGYRVMAVYPNSPLSEIGIEPLLDYMVIPDDNKYFNNTDNFAAIVSKCEGKVFPLNLYNIADQEVRQTKIVPRKWEGRGLLGADFVLEEFTENFSPALRVMSIYAGSPLDRAGVKPFTDYILGTKRQTFQSIQDFEVYIKCCDKAPVSLQVYSSQSENVREVIVIPDKDWGGVGLLGGDITFGAFNAIPPRQNKRHTQSTSIQPPPDLQHSGNNDSEKPML